MGIFGDIGQGLLGVSRGLGRMGGIGGAILGLPAMIDQGIRAGEGVEAQTDLANAMREKMAAGMAPPQAFISVYQEHPEYYNALPEEARTDQLALMQAMGLGDSASAPKFTTLVNPSTQERLTLQEGGDDYLNLISQGWYNSGEQPSVEQPYSPERYAQEEALRKAGGTNVTVGGSKVEIAGQEAGLEQYAKYSAETLNEAKKAAQIATAQIARFDVLETLLGNVKTGKFGRTANEFVKAANAVLPEGWAEKWGVDVNNPDIVDAANALQNELALEMRNTAEGGGLPGSASNADREFLVASTAGIESAPGAWPIMIEVKRRMLKRQKKLYEKLNRVFIEMGPNALTTGALAQAQIDFDNDPANDVFDKSLKDKILATAKGAISKKRIIYDETGQRIQ